MGLSKAQADHGAAMKKIETQLRDANERVDKVNRDMRDVPFLSHEAASAAHERECEVEGGGE